MATSKKSEIKERLVKLETKLKDRLTATENAMIEAKKISKELDKLENKE
jgi:hypothetical protein